MLHLYYNRCDCEEVINCYQMTWNMIIIVVRLCYRLTKITSIFKLLKDSIFSFSKTYGGRTSAFYVIW